MYNYACKSFESLLQDLQKMKKENASSNLGAQENLYCVSMNEISNLHDGSIFQGLKMKEVVRQPKRRLKNALERRKYKKSQNRKQV